MRAHKMTAGVGRTIPQGCDPKQIREKACDAIMRSGRELAAELRTARATCNSACVYALFGATEREVAAGAALGVHSISIRRTLIQKDPAGRIVATSSKRITGDTPGIREAHARVARYAAQMGISREVVEAAAAVPFEKVRYLSRDEIVRFGIDPRTFVENRWTREEDKSGRAGAVKYIVSASAGEPRHRLSLVRLSCVSTRHILVQVARERAPAEKVHSVAVVAGANEIALRPFGKPTASDNGLEAELRVALAAPAYFEAAAKGERIEIVERADASDGTALRMRVSTAGLAGLLGALGDGCR
jgi:hypothetical protein